MVSLVGLLRDQQNPQNYRAGNSMVVQGLRFCGSSAEGPGSISGQGTRFPHVETKSLKGTTKDAASHN